MAKTIDSNWFMLQENIDDLDLLEKNLELTTSLLRESVSNINLCVEEGITEYKRQLLSELFSTADSLQYDSRNLAQLARQAEKLSCLVYVTAIQFNIARGHIKLKTKQAEATIEDAGEKTGPNIKEIIQEVSDRIKQDQTFQTRQEVKNILVQIKLYRKEMEELNKLRTNIPQEKLPGLLANFKNRYNEIAKSITENYRAITREEVSEISKKLAAGHPLHRYQLHTLEGLFRSQLKEISRIRSTVIFIEKERYQTRDYIVKMLAGKDECLGQINKEAADYEKLGITRNEGLKISRMIGNEIITVLEKQISWRNTKREK